MKHAKYLLAVLILSCSGINSKELALELSGRSYTWNIQLENSVITQQLYFINDSLFTLVTQDEEQKYAQFGSWRVTGDLFHAYLSLTDPFGEPSFEVNSWNKKTLILSNGKYSYQAVEMNYEESTLTQDIIGTWIEPLDSFPRTFPEYEESGEFLMNPIFKFSIDSFNIRTKDFRRSGTLKVIDGTTQQLILESESNYMDNKIIIVEQHSRKLLELRLKNDMGQWDHYKLENIDSVQQAL